jgi:hypothetical protein
MRSIGIRLGVAGTIALAAAWLPQLAIAAQEQTVVDMDAVSQDVRTYVAKVGGEVMQHIQAAQKLTATSTDLSGAELETGKALALLESIHHVNPKQRLRQAIGDVLHRHRSGKAKPKADDLVPVFGVLNEVSQVQGVDVADVKTSLEKAKGKLQSGSTVEAEADLVEAYNGVGYLEIDLPLKKTEERLVAARLALSQGDKANANAALSDAITHTKTWTAMAQSTAVEADVEE